jgi:subtilisin family serine protease
MSVLHVALLIVGPFVNSADRLDSTDAVVHPGVWAQLENNPQPATVWVFLTDKGIKSLAEYHRATALAKAGLPERTLHRRKLRGSRRGSVGYDDIAVNQGYVDRIQSSGADIRTRSKWLNAVSVTATGRQMHRIAALPFVRSIEPVRRGRRAEVVPIESPKPVSLGERRAYGGTYGLSEEQLQQIGVPEMHAAGFTGSGMVIGVLDTGFELTHAAYNHAEHPINVIAQYDFINEDGNAGIDEGDAGNQHWHGTAVLSVIAGYLPGDYLGGAYDASFVLAKTEDITDEYPAEEDYYVAGLEFIEANGADVATSSLGYIDWYTWFDLDGLTAVTTIAVNQATANGLVCCTAAGNGGSDSDLPTLLAPADAFDVLSCGAVDADGDTAGFSSNGPTADDRVKPEILARGVSTATVDPNDDAGYITVSGTSLSTPLVASAAALLVQAHPTWTIAEIRTALFQTADYFVENGTHDPEFRRGYGIIDIFAAAQIGPCDVDLDGDELVGAADLAQLLGVWGPCPECAADFNGDGEVDATDLAALLGSWGPCI